jgi:hypothetical protein
VTCERCFARVPATELVCPECGAPLNSDVAVPGADSAVHPELAQANLLRLRGDIEAAERKCLSILKRYPNEPEAHVLLGDLSADRGDWRRAAEWYELAVDLSPNSTADRAKLDEAKKRVEDAETAETVEQLGLPEASPRGPWLVGSVALILVVVIMVAAFWHRPALRTKQLQPINGQVVAPPDRAGTSDAGALGPADSGSATPANSDAGPAAPTAPLEDRTLMDMLVKRSTEGGQLISLVQDPRDHAVTLTYSVPASGDARRIGAILARDALNQSTETLIVTVRGVSGEELVYVADATRSKLADAEAASGQADAATSDTWISQFMQREWTPQSSSGSGTAAAPSEGGSSSGAGTEGSTGATPESTSAKPGN